MNPEIKPWKEKLSIFLKETTHQNFQYLLKHEAIEDDDLDFKRDLLPFDELAKHILAMANKHGGAIVFGVEEIENNVFKPCGLFNNLDITDIEKKIYSYLPRELQSIVRCIPFFLKEDELEDHIKGKQFLVVIVDYEPRYLPFVAAKKGEKLRKDFIYIRRNRASEPINHEELQELLNKRIDTQHSTTTERELREHLDELKELYGHIPRNISKVISRTPGILSSLNPISNATLVSIYGETKYEHIPNPNYPEEDYEKFVKRIIEIKKKVIEDLIKK